jgi:hypothetical protein
MDDLGAMILGGQQPSTSKMPAPMRNNNPGALMPGGKLAQYASPEEGMNALDSNLKSYGKQGVNTLEGVISKWAPPSENDTQAYIAHAAQVTGLDPKATIDLTNNPYVRQNIMAAIIQHENGRAAVNGAPSANRAQPTQDAPAAQPNDDLGAMILGKMPASPAPQPEQPGNPYGAAVRDVVANQVTGLGAQVAGGYAGLVQAGKALANYDSKLSLADNLRAAADRGAAAVDQVQQQYTYQPEAGSMGAKAVDAFASNYNPLNLPGRAINAAGDITADYAGPALGTAVKTVGTGALMALGLRGKGSVPLRSVAEAAPSEAALSAPQTIAQAVAAKQAAAEQLSANAQGAGIKPLASAAPAAAPIADARTALAAQFAARQAANQSGLQSAGAAAADQASTQAALAADATPEVAAKINKTPGQYFDAEAARTASLESKHGIDLISGQRTGDTALYADQYNNRGAFAGIGNVLQEQPKQVANALDNVRNTLAPDLYDHGPNAIGQAEIDGFVKNDQIRNKNINEAYGAIQSKYEQLRAQQGLPPTADFPVDGQKFVTSAREALAKNSATYDLPSGIASELADIEKNGGNMTFEKFMSLNKNLSTKIREGKGSERAAAYIVKDELQKLPLVGGAAELKPLVDNATALARERFETLKNVPGYKEAVGGAVSADDAMQGIGSATADTFHRKYVSNGSAADVQRMVRELGQGSQAQQAMAAGEIEALKKKAGLTSENPDLRPKALNDYLYQNREKANTVFGGQGAQALSEINELTNKIGMPRSGVFNHSNTLSGGIAQIGGKYVGGAAEAALAGATHGTSIPVVSALKAAYAARKGKNYEASAINKGSGIDTRD